MDTTEKTSNGVKEEPKTSENSTANDKPKIEQFQVANEDEDIP